VLSALRSNAINAQARATVAALLHRFDAIAVRPVTPGDIAQLTFDRLTMSWESIFQRAKWLLQGLFPDVRSGDVDGTCLLFNMERLFEAFLGAKVRQAWQGSSNGIYRIMLQGPQRNLARSDTDTDEAFELRPDIAVFDEGGAVRIFDTKWKRLDPNISSFGVPPADVYQLAAYASRYRCERVALVYPASVDCPPGLVERYTLVIPDAPYLEVYAVDLRALCFGGGLPVGMLPPRGKHQSRSRFASADV
jgi:5-methylcytosine-specific restriction enzyme subunit McrC